MAVTIKWLDATATSTADASITTLDLGTITAGNYVEKQFKVGNVGTSLAESVVISAIGSDTDAVSWKNYKVGAGSYGATASVPNIASNTISDAITIKSTVPLSATAGVHSTLTQIAFVYS